MTHEEYVLRLDSLTDAEAPSVLDHTGSCPLCRREMRRAEAALARLAPRRRSLAEEIARWAAMAAVLAVIGFGLYGQRGSRPNPAPTARYRIVGDASGVVAYTPGGIVVGMSARPASKESVR